MKVYVGPNFPVVARYEVKGKDDVYFRGNESDLAKVNTDVYKRQDRRIRTGIVFDCPDKGVDR